MLYEMLDEILTKLEEYEKTDPDEIKYKHVSFESLKLQIRSFKEFWPDPMSSQ